uniref:Uncharacterized protein n=1 Tax=Opuntia streptacantha TaxID=393608 RepID=A0A7C8YVR8_OPUST
MEGQSSSAPSTTTASSSKPPEVPRESFARRYKFLWPLLLTVNLAVGAYLFMRTKKKDVTVEDEPTGAAPATSSASATPPTSAVPESPTAALPIIAQPLTAVGPVPAEQQRELFKWMLEEKRKIKTKDPEEKKKIDEEKAILKQFIRAKSIPSI